MCSKYYGIINGITSLGINQLFLNNVSVSVEIFIDCNTYQLMVKNIFLDISNGYNSTTGQYDIPVTSINGTPYDDIINEIILNNSSTINFNTPSYSFNLKSCSDPSSQSNLDAQCKNLVNVLNSHIDNSLFPTVDLSNNTNVTGILKLICGN